MSESNYLTQDPEDAKIFSPSAAIKFLIDGEKSRNLLVQATFDGVEDPYFFANDLTNHPTPSSNDCMLNTLVKKFVEGGNHPFSLGTSHLTTIEENGEVIAESDAMFPYELILIPNRDEFKREDMKKG